MSGAPSQRPRIGSKWTADQVEVCEVRATWSDGVVVRWPTRSPDRKAIYTPLSKFYAELSRVVAPYDPTAHADRFTEGG